MKDMLRVLGIGVAILIVLTSVIGLLAKGMPMIEDLKVVEPKAGIECAIVSRIAHTSIDCWKKEGKL